MSYLIIGILIFSITSCDGLFNKNNHDLGGGELVWSLDNEGSILIPPQPLIEDPYVYFLQDRKMKCYKIATGDSVWTTDLNPYFGTTMGLSIMSAGDQLLYDLGYYMLSINKADGKINWATLTTEIPIEVTSYPTFNSTIANNKIYIPRNGFVLALDLNSGKEVFRIELDSLKPDSVRQGSPEVIVDQLDHQTLYVAGTYDNNKDDNPITSDGGNIFAYDAQNGDYIWGTRVKVRVPNIFTDDPADSVTISPEIYDIDQAHDAVYALSQPYLVKLDKATGEIDWKVELSGMDKGLATDEENVYVASIGAKAFSVDQSSGHINWETSVTYSNSNPLTVKEDRVYYASGSGGSIWVFNKQTGSPIFHSLPPDYSEDPMNNLYASPLAVGAGYMFDVGYTKAYCLTIP